MGKWSDSSVLKALPSPTPDAYEVKIKSPELTFLGVKDQPDFARLHVLMYPGATVIELRAFKAYLYQFRNTVISYERLINVIYDDIMSVYGPKRLRLMLECNPRGGISSRITIDSDWKSRGGSEQYQDWPEDDF